MTFFRLAFTLALILCALAVTSTAHAHPDRPGYCLMPGGTLVPGHCTDAQNAAGGHDVHLSNEPAPTGPPGPTPPDSNTPSSNTPAPPGSNTPAPPSSNTPAPPGSNAPAPPGSNTPGSGPPPPPGSNGPNTPGSGSSPSPPGSNGGGGSNSGGGSGSTPVYTGEGCHITHAATPAQICSVEGGLQYWYIGADGSAQPGPYLPDEPKIESFSGTNPMTGKSVTIDYITEGDKLLLRVSTFYPDNEYDTNKPYVFTLDPGYSVSYISW